MTQYSPTVFDAFVNFTSVSFYHLLYGERDMMTLTTTAMINDGVFIVLGEPPFYPRQHRSRCCDVGALRPWPLLPWESVCVPA